MPTTICAMPECGRDAFSTAVLTVGKDKKTVRVALCRYCAAELMGFKPPLQGKGTLELGPDVKTGGERP